MILLFANNAESSIAAPISAAATSVQLYAGDGAMFPVPVVGQQFFKLTFVDAATGLLNEIVNVTQRVGDVLTIVRGQEGTTARAWSAGDSATNMVTRDTQNAFSQVPQTQAGATNFSLDTGTTNSYAVVLTPPVTTRIPGLCVRIKARNSNTGPVTLNIGAGSFPIVNPDGSQLGPGAIIAGGIFEVVDDGANYQLISSSQQAQSSAGAATTGDVKWRPTTESLTGWVVANGSTIGGPNSNSTQLSSAAAANLFAWLWNNFSNSQCPVFTSTGVATSRGVNAATDFAAGYRIQVLDLQGVIPIGMDSMGGPATYHLAGVPVVSGQVWLAGSVIGENLHQILLAEMASHYHGADISDPGHYHTYMTAEGYATTPGGGTTIYNTYAAYLHNTDPAYTGVQVTSPNGNGSTGSIGENVAHNNVPLAMTGYIYIKL